MRFRFPSLRRAGLIFALWLTLQFSASAHNPDTSYTRIRVSRDQIEFKFTLDLVTVSKIVDLDDNRDHRITKEELNRHAPAIYDFLRERIKLRIGKKPGDFGEPEPAQFSENIEAATEKDYHQTLVHFVFRKDVALPPDEFTLIYEIFATLGDRHTNLALIEESAAHSEEIIFTKFEPDYTYFTNTQIPLRSQMFQFLKLGVKHIFLGYDHILFLLALIVVSKFWDLLKIVTAFTVAHTITLMLAALEIVRLPPRLIETSIAVTIMYVALENLWVKKTSHRWMLTFGFGLIHGFGFANVLRDLGLPTQGLVRSLVCFNLGVEVGQITIVLLLLPFSLWLAKRSFAKKARAGVSIVIFLFGAAWFIERAFGLPFMPF